jgi:hypothetical protein
MVLARTFSSLSSVLICVEVVWGDRDLAGAGAGNPHASCRRQPPMCRVGGRAVERPVPTECTLRIIGYQFPKLILRAQYLVGGAAGWHGWQPRPWRRHTRRAIARSVRHADSLGCPCDWKRGRSWSSSNEIGVRGLESRLPSGVRCMAGESIGPSPGEGWQSEHDNRPVIGAP